MIQGWCFDDTAKTEASFSVFFIVVNQTFLVATVFHLIFLFQIVKLGRTETTRKTCYIEMIGGLKDGLCDFTMIFTMIVLL